MAFALLVWKRDDVIDGQMDFLFDTSDPPMDLSQLLEGEGIPDASRAQPRVWLDVWTTCRRSRLRRPPW